MSCILLTSACALMQVTNNVAGFMGHLGSQALDPSYYMEQFGELKHKLEDPIAVGPFPSCLLCLQPVRMPHLHVSHANCSPILSGTAVLFGSSTAWETLTR